MRVASGVILEQQSPKRDNELQSIRLAIVRCAEPSSRGVRLQIQSGEALREEKEKKRLERLALINQSKPYVYERNIYVGYPYRLWKTYRRGGHYNGSKPVQGPTVGHRTSSMNLPSSSFH